MRIKGLNNTFMLSLEGHEEIFDFRLPDDLEEGGGTKFRLPIDPAGVDKVVKAGGDRDIMMSEMAKGNLLTGVLPKSGICAIL